MGNAEDSKNMIDISDLQNHDDENIQDLELNSDGKSFYILNLCIPFSIKYKTFTHHQICEKFDICAVLFSTLRTHIIGVWVNIF